MYETVEEANQMAYQYIGLYAVNFQKIISSLQIMIYHSFRMFGFTRKDLIDIFLADRAANDILTIARGLFNEVFHLEQPDKIISENLFKAVKKTIEQRNHLIHGFSYIGFTYDGQTDFSSFSHERIKKTKDGVFYDVTSKEIQDIKVEAEEAYDQASQLYQLAAYVTIKSIDPNAPIVLSEYIKIKVGL